MKKAELLAENERFRLLLTRLLLGIDEAAEYDEGECLPECLYDTYIEARAAIGHPAVFAKVPDSCHEESYQLLRDAMDGEPWPPEEWVDHKPAKGQG